MTKLERRGPIEAMRTLPRLMIEEELAEYLGVDKESLRCRGENLDTATAQQRRRFR
jgi:hypothetical protein